MFVPVASARQHVLTLAVCEHRSTVMLQEAPRRTLLLDKGQVGASKLLEIQQHHPHHHLRLEIEPLARPGMPQVPSMSFPDTSN